MGGRYLVTGVQLGVLLAEFGDIEKLRSCVDEIIHKQFVFGSMNTITEDCIEVEAMSRDGNSRK